MYYEGFTSLDGFDDSYFGWLQYRVVGSYSTRVTRHEVAARVVPDRLDRSRLRVGLAKRFHRSCKGGKWQLVNINFKRLRVSIKQRLISPSRKKVARLSNSAT